MISDYGDVPALVTTYHMAAEPRQARPRRRSTPAWTWRCCPFNADQLERPRPAGRGRRQHLARQDRPVRAADPDAEVRARPVRPPARRPDRGRRRGRGGPRRGPQGRATSRSRCCATSTATLPLSDSTQAGRDRPERRLDDQPARRLERQLAGRGRRRARAAAWARPTRSRRAPRSSRACRPQDPNVTYAPDQATAVSDAASADAVVVVVGEKAYAEGLGDDPAPQLPADQQALISGARGDRQAGDRGRDRGPAARASARPRTPTAC